MKGFRSLLKLESGKRVLCIRAPKPDGLGEDMFIVALSFGSPCAYIAKQIDTDRYDHGKEKEIELPDDIVNAGVTFVLKDSARKDAKDECEKAKGAHEEAEAAFDEASNTFWAIGGLGPLLRPA